MRICAVLLLLEVTGLAAGASSDDYYKAIRTNDLAQLKSLVSAGDVNVRDRHGATPLMYAASVGSVAAVKVLLAAGADAKVKNSFDATALMWGITNLEKVRLLVDAGADVNARSKQGMTPLLIAASNAGSIEIVRLLLAKGADVNSKRDSGAPTAAAVTPDPSDPLAKRRRHSGGEGGYTPLVAAASANDLEMVRLFVEKGVDVNAESRRGDTALHFAAGAGNLAMVKLLLTKGANVNAATQESIQVRKGPIGLNHLTALIYAAPYGTPELVGTLIDAGAQVNAKDIRDMTPLMLAVSSETQSPEVVRLLLAKGADVKAKSVLGETSLDWAKKFGNPEVIRLLQEAGAGTPVEEHAPAAAASQAGDARAAMGKAVSLLQRSSTEFFKESGCVGCHHQNFTAMAVGAARKAGVRIDEAAAEEQLKVVKTQWMGAQEALLQRLDPPGASDTLSFSLLGLGAVDYPADAVTDAMVLNFAAEQTLDGSWCYGGLSRSPISEGCIGRAAIGAHLLQLYGPPGMKAEFDQRIARARHYLLETPPKTTDDLAMRLLGLKWAAAEKEAIGSAARALLQQQRGDGGWAGNRYLASDAYSTAEAVYALGGSGVAAAGDTARGHGIEFLMKTQQPDGSWHVKSRAVKFQPYFQSGFPYDHDQWISAAATAWATVALANAIPAGEQRAAR
jgi:ankyrin repeat protein